MKFAMQGAQDNGEFFTPPSLVQTIVNVIEPDHGIVFDPAAGSGGMFVQTGHFLQDQGESAAQKVTFYGHESVTAQCPLARRWSIYSKHESVKAWPQMNTYSRER